MANYELEKTGAEIDAIHTKVDGIEAGADVTDEANVSATASVIANTAKISYTDATAVGLNTTHRTSDGTDHSYINQDVTTSGTPTFASATISATLTAEDIKLNTNNTSRITAVDAGSDNVDIEFIDSSDRLVHRAPVSGSHVWQVGSGDRMSMDSSGNLSVSGTVDGIDIATDVAANTTHRTSDGKNHSDVVLNNAYRAVGHLPLIGGTLTNTLTIDQNNDVKGLVIDSEATSNGNFGLEVSTPATTRVAYFGTSTNNRFEVQNDSAVLGRFYRNLASTTTAYPVVEVIQDNAGDDQTALNIQQDGTGTGIFINQEGNGKGLYIDSEATSAGSYGLHVQSAGGHRAAYIEQAGDNIALYVAPTGVLTESAFRVYSNALHTGTVTSSLVNIQQDNAGATGDVMSIRNDGSGDSLLVQTANASNESFVTGRTNKSTGFTYIRRNLTSANTSGPVVNILQDNVSDDQNALTIQNDGTGDALTIDQNGNGIALSIANTGNQKGLEILQNAVLAPGRQALQVYSNEIQTTEYLSQFWLDNPSSTSKVISILNDIDHDGNGAASAMVVQRSGGTGRLVNLQNLGTGNALFINQDGDGIALEIDSEATTVPMIQWNGEGGKLNGHIGDKDAGVGSFWFMRNVTSSESAGPVMFIEQDNVSDDQNALTIQNDGTGVGHYILQSGDRTALEIWNGNIAKTDNLVEINMGSSSSTGNVINLRNDGTGDGLIIDQNGDGVALNIDTECANDTAGIKCDFIDAAFKVTRNTDVDTNAVIELSGNYLWVDSTGDLRISTTYPTTDTSGVVVGSQS